MKLYFTAGACSLAVHIALEMTGRPFLIEEVDLDTRRTSRGHDFLAINPKGYVPALEIEGARVLTEVPVILQYLDALAPDARLFPTDQTERLHALEWLHYLASEIHKSFSPLFRPDTPHAFLEVGRRHLQKRLAIVETSLQDGPFLLGPKFSIPDAYLFTLCRWLPAQEMDLGRWPMLKSHFRRVGALSAVKEALSNEAILSARSARSGGLHGVC